MSQENLDKALVPRNTDLSLQATGQELFEKNLKSISDFFFKRSDTIVFQNMQGLAGRSQFLNLEKFIKSYRPREVMAVTPELVTWLTKVAPSCVYPVRFRGEGLHYQCVFCETPIKVQQSMIRHYREQHHDLMPHEIFGPVLEYRCKLCKIYVGKRQEHLDMHYKSLGHLEMLAAKGSVNAQNQVANYNEKKVLAHFNEKKEKRRKFEAEQTEWETLFQSVKANSASRFPALREETTSDESDGEKNEPDNPKKRRAYKTEADDEAAIFIRGDHSDSDAGSHDGRRVLTENDEEDTVTRKASRSNTKATASNSCTTRKSTASIQEQSRDNDNQKAGLGSSEEESDEYEDADNEQPRKLSKKSGCPIVKSLSTAFNLNVSLTEELGSNKVAKSHSGLF